mmetsp:Transcript_15233/g.22799  ORF Transcript_15233/g.22799 Transcript_15233/m.22799 type:complete len:132 (+) Transcript_15233:65-460(+)
MAAGKTQILQLYRNLLKSAQSWPQVKGRETRCFGVHYKDTIRREFKAHAHLTEHDQIVHFIDHYRIQLTALDQLERDRFFNEYQSQGVPVDQMPELVGRAGRLLSSKNQTKIEKRRWGFAERLMGFFIRDR